MMDLANEKGLGSTDRINGQNPEADPDSSKSCADCHTTRTPLWRAGPSGPKSLCNACGIRYRKSRRAALGLKGETGMKSSKKMGVFLGLNQIRAVLLNRKSGMLREEEEAAVLLMALSSGLLCNPNQ